MAQANYMQIIPDSQYVTELEQIAMQLQNIKYLADNRLYDKGYYDKDGVGSVRLTSIQDDIDHLLIAVRNSISQGYKVTKDENNTILSDKIKNVLMYNTDTDAILKINNLLKKYE